MQFPKNKEIAHVYASALSMWGNERGALTSVKDGVAAKVRDVATAAEDYQVLGRAHFVLPYVPLILSWPDKKLADKYLNMALQRDPKDIYNYYFMAELRFDQKRYAQPYRPRTFTRSAHELLPRRQTGTLAAEGTPEKDQRQARQEITAEAGD